MTLFKTKTKSKNKKDKYDCKGCKKGRYQKMSNGNNGTLHKCSRCGAIVFHDGIKLY